MKYLHTLTLVGVFLIATLTATSQTAPVVTIIHTNDTHSQIDPYLYTKGRARLRGGAAERAAVLGYYRQQDPDLLYFDCGDIVQGTPYFNIFGGEVEILCMNQQKLLASTLGNHEFDNGLEFMANYLSKADFPLICANYHCEGTPIAPYILPHMILSSHDVKVGVTGVSVDPNDLVFARNWAGITFENPAEAVNREAQLLRAEGCDVVIVLSHLGYEPQPKPGHTKMLDNDLVPLIRGVDVVLGGHSHTNIPSGQYMTDAEQHRVLVTQTGGKDAPMGFVRLYMKEGSTYPACHFSVDSILCCKLDPEHLPVSTLSGPAPDSLTLAAFGHEMEEYIAPYRESMTAKMNVRLAHAPEALTRDRSTGTLGNFTSDAFRVIGQQMSGHTIDISVMNRGGLRSDLAAGEVTLGSIYSIFPFENTIMLIDLRGSDLLDLIQANAARKLDCWSGAQIQLECDGDLWRAKQILVGGQTIDPERIYHICTIDYLAEGNGGMSALTRAISAHNTGVLIRDAMTDYIKQLDAQGKSVVSQVDDRITIIDN